MDTETTLITLAPAASEEVVASSIDTETVEQTKEKTPKHEASTMGWRIYMVTASEHIEQDEPLLKVGGCTILSRGNILTIIGKPKSFKTFAVSAIAGAMITGDFLGMTSEVKMPKILLIDTEQGKARTQLIVRRIDAITGRECTDVIALSVRQENASSRLKALKDAVEDVQPDIVLLDGVRDLLNNFNDIEESCMLVTELMKLSEVYSCGIVTVIHQSKADVNARGHLGSELMNKSETVIELRKTKNNTAIVSPVHCRNMDFEEFAFKVNKEGLPEKCDHNSKDDDTDTLRTTMEYLIDTLTTISKKELVAKIVEYEECCIKTAERRIDKALIDEILKKETKNTYSLLPAQK